MISTALAALVLALTSPSDTLVEAFETTANCTGLERETHIVHEGLAAGRWSRMDRRSGVALKAAPRDWSAYNALSLWVYNAKILPDTAFMMIVGSERKETEGSDYYALRFDLGRWTGWKQFLVPFAELGVARQPLGFQHIDGVSFTARGYGNTPNPQAVVCFDDFRLLRIKRVEGPRLSDQDLFAAMKLDDPALAPIGRAVAAGDFSAAKAAWLEHLQRRTYPRWTVDWHQRRPARPAPPPGGSPGWDYYSHHLRFDWSGWRHFHLEKKDFHAARRPIGWNWIDSLSITAAGFGQTPDPKAVLYFDDVRLVGRKRTVTLGDFEHGPGAWEGLVASPEQAKTGRFAGKWQHLPLVTSIRLADLPTDWTEFDALEFWCYAPQATGATAMLILDSDQPRPTGADEILRHVIQGHDFGPDIDWSADPHHYREWTYSVNRFYHWRALAEAYWSRGDERYAREFCTQLLDWVRKNPLPLFSSGNGSYTWRTIECGIRQSTTWPDSLYRVLGSASFTPEVAAVMTKSMVEHARHLMEWPSRGGNWLTMESNGLGTIGILLPELKEARQWRQTALRRQYAELDNQVYADGAQIELTTGYHQVSLQNFLGLAHTAILNQVALPADYHQKLRRMFEYNLWVQMPDGRTPALNDGSLHAVRADMQTAAELYKDPLFQWAASGGTEGARPRETSHYFPYAGQMVMRSGWDAEARYLLMDAGPFGFGHQHEDKLNIVVYAYGKQQIADPGSYDYDSSPWRRYTIDTPAHNTVMVDGLSQCRRACDRETYVVKQPPATNVWISGPELDYAAGQYDEGYGPQRKVKVVHRREVVFVKPDYWLVVDRFEGRGTHRYESLFHFDADEAQVDASGIAVRTIDPAPNCLVAAAPQRGLAVKIVKGQTEPSVQGFIAGQRWRASWKEPHARPPEHGKREVPTAVFSLSADGPARLVYVIYPYRQGQRPQVTVEDLTDGDARVRVAVLRPDGRRDQIVLDRGARVTRAN